MSASSTHAGAAEAAVEQAGRYGPDGRSPWLDIDWREHQRWVLVEGQAVNTIELGEGPPIVLRHHDCGEIADPTLVCGRCGNEMSAHNVTPEPGPGYRGTM